MFNGTADFFPLAELEYSESELQDWFCSLPPNTCRILLDNIYAVGRNIQYLMDDFDHDLLLRFVRFYPNTFVMEPRTFAGHIDKAKGASEDWAEIIKKQFFGYDGTVPWDSADFARCVPYLEVISSYDDEAVQCALDTGFRHPWQRFYGFISLLNQRFGSSMTAADFDKNALYDLECGKHELVCNAELLISEGLTKESLLSIVINNPWLLLYGQDELREVLYREFGIDYIDAINHWIEFDKDGLEERLWSI